MIISGGSLLVVTPTGICIGCKVSASRVNSQSQYRQWAFPSRWDTKHTNIFLLRGTQCFCFCPFLSCMKYHITHSLSDTFARCLLLMLPYVQTYTSSPSRACVLRHLLPQHAYTFVWKCTFALICNFQLLLVGMCKYEPMFGKDVFKGTKKILEIDYAQPQNIVRIHAEQA